MYIHVYIHICVYTYIYSAHVYFLNKSLASSAAWSIAMGKRRAEWNGNTSVTREPNGQTTWRNSLLGSQTAKLSIKFGNHLDSQSIDLIKNQSHYPDQSDPTRQKFTTRTQNRRRHLPQPHWCRRWKTCRQTCPNS